MRQYAELEILILEGFWKDFALGPVPQMVIDVIKKSSNEKQYIAALKLAKKIYKDGSHGHNVVKMTPEFALVKAAQQVGIDPKELNRLVAKRKKRKN